MYVVKMKRDFRSKYSLKTNFHVSLAVYCYISPRHVTFFVSEDLIESKLGDVVRLVE